MVCHCRQTSRPAALRCTTTLAALLLLAALCTSRPLHSRSLAQSIAAFQPLSPVGERLRWRGVSQLVFYRQQLWFVNSNPFQDTNAADLYHFDPASGQLHYQRSLFSQDIGNPVVFNGLLHLPFEDPRRSAGRGEYVRTDGRRYQWQALPSGRAFHLHALASCHGALTAVTGAFSGQLHQYDNRVGWQLISNYPRGEAGFSRLVSVLEYGDHCLIGALARNDSRAKLLQLRGTQLLALDDWPAGDRSETLTVFAGKALAFNDLGDSRTLLSWDGRQATTLPLPAGRPRGLAADGDSIYLISGDARGGALWVADQQFDWQLLQRFSDTPIALAVRDGRVFVGGWARQGGVLYSDARRQALPITAAKALPSSTAATMDAPTARHRARRWYQRLARADATLDDLRNILSELDSGEHPRVLQQLATMVDALPDSGTLTLFGSRQMQRRAVIAWYVQTTAALRGALRPTAAQLSRPFEQPANRSAKYLDAAVAAIIGAGRARPVNGSPTAQSQHSWINALGDRLQNNDDPDWLRADVISALSNLSGQRFGHDTARWLRWFDSTDRGAASTPASAPATID